MNALFDSWKTTLAGLGGAGLIIALGAYTPGMTPKQWFLAALLALAVAAHGVAAQDHKTTP